MHDFLIATIILSMAISPVVPDRLETRDSFEMETPVQLTREIKWPRKNIEVAFSTSLLAPGEQIKHGSDVVGAARRALSRWSNFADVNFVVVWSSDQSVSPISSADGVSLITVADTVENENFNRESTTARTRVFFNSETATITEADISINPLPRSQNGAAMQFSTDGTPGTYDLEATFTHEIGHLLGLDHSNVLASTMQSQQAFNGMLGGAAFTARTLSEDDKQKIRKLYGPKRRLSRVEGRVTTSSIPANRLTIFAENSDTGKLVASVVTASDGSYSLNLEPGKYRLFAEPVRDDGSSNQPVSGSSTGAVEKKLSGIDLSSEIVVKPNEASSLDYSVESPRTSFLNLNPRWIGLNAELSTVALPVQPGKRVKILIGGPGVDQVPVNGISINSPYFSIDQSSLIREELRTEFPVVSFEAVIAANAPFGDYSIRLQSNSGELAHLPGALTIDPGVATTHVNPLDDANFFVSQQYADTFGAEGDRANAMSFITEIVQCGGRADCLRKRRLELSSSLLTQSGLIDDINFLNSLYWVAFNRRVTLSEFESVRGLFARSGHDSQSRLSVVLSVVERPEFERKYSATMKPGEFADSILGSLKQGTVTESESVRKLFVDKLDGTSLGRAVALKSLLEIDSLLSAHYNDALVLAEYFTFLRRDPDESGFAIWSNFLKSRVSRDSGVVRSLSCQFLNSEEYQHRFGMVATHTPSECN